MVENNFIVCFSTTATIKNKIREDNILTFHSFRNSLVILQGIQGLCGWVVWRPCAPGAVSWCAAAFSRPVLRAPHPQIAKSACPRLGGRAAVCASRRACCTNPTFRDICTPSACETWSSENHAIMYSNFQKHWREEISLVFQPHCCAGSLVPLRIQRLLSSPQNPCWTFLRIGCPKIKLKNKGQGFSLNKIIICHTSEQPPHCQLPFGFLSLTLLSQLHSLSSPLEQDFVIAYATPAADTA